MEQRTMLHLPPLRKRTVSDCRGLHVIWAVFKSQVTRFFFELDFPIIIFFLQPPPLQIGNSNLILTRWSFLLLFFLTQERSFHSRESELLFSHFKNLIFVIST